MTSAEVRAIEEMDRAREAMEATPGVGRPRKGRETRSVYAVRVEPRHIDALRSHGLTLGEVIEAVADCVVAANTDTRVGRLLRALDL